MAVILTQYGIFFFFLKRVTLPLFFGVCLDDHTLLKTCLWTPILDSWEHISKQDRNTLISHNSDKLSE